MRGEGRRTTVENNFFRMDEWCISIVVMWMGGKNSMGTNVKVRLGLWPQAVVRTPSSVMDSTEVTEQDCIVIYQQKATAGAGR